MKTQTKPQTKIDAVNYLNSEMPKILAEYVYKEQTIVKSGSGWASIGSEIGISVYAWAKTLRELKQKINHKILLQSI